MLQLCSLLVTYVCAFQRNSRFRQRMSTHYFGSTLRTDTYTCVLQRTFTISYVDLRYSHFVVTRILNVKQLLERKKI